MSLAAGAGAALAALSASLGRPALAAFGRQFVPMSPLTAGAVVLLSAVLLMMDRWPRSRGMRRLACGAAAGVASLSLGFIVGHLQGETMALERWLVSGRTNVQLTSMLTDLALLGAALSILGRWIRPHAPWAWRQAAALLALVPLLTGGVVLVSYGAGAPLLYGSGHIPMALPTALCVVLLGAALHGAAGCDTWPLAAFGLGSERPREWSILGYSAGALTLFLLIGTFVLTGGAFVLRSQIRSARSRAQAELESIAELKVRQTGAWYRERRADADLIFRSELIRAQLLRVLSEPSQAAGEQVVREWMTQFQARGYRRVVLFDAQGRPRLSVPVEQGGDPSEALEVGRALASGEVSVEDLHEDLRRSEIHLRWWVPIQSGAKQTGVLLLDVDPRQFLYPLIQSWPTTSASAETVLVRRDGGDAVVLNELRHQPRTALTLRYGLGTHPQLPTVRASLGSEGLMEGVDDRGVSVLAVLKGIPGTDWRMVVKVDEAEIFGPLRQQVWAGGLGLMGVLALVGAGFGLVLRHHDADMVRKQLNLAQRFEWLMREANDIILLTDDQGVILEANLQAVTSYGYDLPELLGMNILELRPAESRAEGQDLFRRTKAQTSLRFESVHRRKDGRRFPVEVSSRAVHLDGALRVIIFVRDTTERETQEAELLRMTRLYSALSQVNQAIVWSTTREALFSRICEVMVELGRFSMAWIGVSDPQSGRVSVAAKYGDATGYLDGIRVETGPSRLGLGPVGLAIREGRACVENDFLASLTTKPWHTAAAGSGFKAMAAFPIRQGGEVIGALAVYAMVKDFFGEQECALLEEAAVDISFSLDHLAGEARRRETESALMESERFLKEAQEAGAIGTYTWFIREDRWRSSPFLDQIFGIGPEYPRDEQGWAHLVAPEFRTAMHAYVSGIIARHERFDRDYPIIRVSDGALRWVHGQGDIQRDAEGRPVALVGVIQDITERKEAEQSIRKISVAIEQSPLSVLITNPMGDIEYVNPAFTQITGYRADEVLGLNPRLLRSPRTPLSLYQAMWDTLSRGETWVGEFENLKKNGEVFFERATIAPVRDEQGGLMNYIAIKEDITQDKRAEAERRSLESQLHQSQKLESLGSLAGGVAHDMNNVLGAILGLASALQETAAPSSPSQKNLETIINACLRGRGVVKSLLYFAKKDLQEERLLDLNELVREMTQLLSHTTLKRVELSLDLREGLGQLRGDPGALSHALMNLCVNAIDAMPGGGILQIRTEQGATGDLLLHVRDSGEGMSPEVLAKAVEPFFTTKPKGKGTGLGLAMVYGTMKAHEGSFDLLSQPGQGTEAILRFPAGRVERPGPGVAAASPVVMEPEERLRVLLVDDDELIREAVAPMLEVLGHAVVAANDGFDAIRLLKAGLKADLVILDMNMPGLNGAETLPRILELRPDMPVIMATGYSDHEVAPLLEGRPTVSSLRKPFSLKEVRQAIAGVRVRGAAPMRDSSL
ncbi:MAG TPA: PAS domain S-box protein [Geothrix sp.]|nr:PAS domain S-box protein [Geothrix sp.]